MSKKLFVGNLNLATKENSLKSLFAPYGQVMNASISVNRQGESQGFGFIEMATVAAATKAIAALNGAEFEGKKITVNQAKPAASRDKRRVLANRRNRGNA